MILSRDLLEDPAVTYNNRPIVTSGRKQRIVTMERHLTQSFLVAPENDE